MVWRIESLEGRLKLCFAVVLLLQFATCALLLTVWRTWEVVTLACILGVLLTLLFRSSYELLIAVFRRASTQLDALQGDDYSIRAKPVFSAGRVAELHQQMGTLADSLQRRMSGQHQHSLLLYRLIDQLNTPMLIFDQKLRLSYANHAFTHLFGLPWERQRNVSPQGLGLVSEPRWQFKDPQKAQQWQIRHSLFWEQGRGHQLLVFIDIQTALRESQLQAWQKLIQIMSHEIRNSLTPVAALVQSLQVRSTDERQQLALQVIDERCRHLQEFVKRYTGLHKAHALKPQWLHAGTLFQRLNDLFPKADLEASGLHAQLWADDMLLQQVLINLTKNALEAGSAPGTIKVTFLRNEQNIEVRIADRGQGIARPDNLFVPFYSTKPQGQGIGLALSRHFIEQMGGQLTLANNMEGTGACASIRLPQPPRMQQRPISEHGRPESDVSHPV
jgi:two-component system, NtrC family, nitrogen regulation sensor histidine kinase NtrY